MEKRWVVLAFEIRNGAIPSFAAEMATDAVLMGCPDSIERGAMVYAGHREGPPEWVSGPVENGRGRRRSPE